MLAIARIFLVFLVLKLKNIFLFDSLSVKKDWETVCELSLLDITYSTDFFVVLFPGILQPLVHLFLVWNLMMELSWPQIPWVSKNSLKRLIVWFQKISMSTPTPRMVLWITPPHPIRIYIPVGSCITPTSKEFPIFLFMALISGT